MNEAALRAILHKTRGVEGKNPVSVGQEREIAPPSRASVVDEVRAKNGNLRAVEICSAPLEDHLWIIMDRDFEPRDGLAIYYAEEIPLLRNKTIEELRGIHRVKLEFPGCRVIQEGPELGNH